MQVLRSNIVPRLTGHYGDSCSGSKAMAEVKGLVAYHPYCGKRLPIHAARTQENQLGRQSAAGRSECDPFGNRFVFIKACG